MYAIYPDSVLREDYRNPLPALLRHNMLWPSLLPYTTYSERGAVTRWLPERFGLSVTFCDSGLLRYKEV